MAWRLEDSLIEGHLTNLKPKSTHGFLVLEGREAPVVFELTGDAGKFLRGRSFHFHRNPAAPPPKLVSDHVAQMQIGVVGSMELRMARVLLEDYREARAQGRKPASDWRPVLSLEWYSQNGRMVIELEDPVVLITEGEPFDELETPEGPAMGGFSVAELRQGPDDAFEVRMFALAQEEDDGEGDESLESHLDRLNREKGHSMRGSEEDPMELELGERLVRTDDGEFLSSLLDPQQLPPVGEVDEAQAEGLVLGLLVQLALRNVALHLCPHCTYRDAYRYLVEELLFSERVPRELAGSGWTQNFLYSEVCPQCLAEIDEQFRENNRS